jgi:hypothetical protein
VQKGAKRRLKQGMAPEEVAAWVQKVLGEQQ